MIKITYDNLNPQSAPFRISNAKNPQKIRNPKFAEKHKYLDVHLDPGI